MDIESRQFVRTRADSKCEYCQIVDSALDLPFHVEQIIASVHHVIVGVTPCGRGTARLLDMNCEPRVQLRRQLMQQDEFESK